MKMSLFQCQQVGAMLTAIACEGDDNLTGMIKVSPDGKLDPNAQAEDLYVWEVHKIFTAAVIASQEPGGVFADKATAPDVGSVLGQFKPILDQVLPLLGGNASGIAQAVLGLLTGGGAAPTPAAGVPAGTSVPPLSASAGS